jgi:hypothetical protein
MRRVGAAVRQELGAVFVFAVLAVWGLATPLWAGPDEPAHVFRAVAVADGQFVGRHADGEPSAVTAVRIPAVYGLGARAGCWIMKPDRVPGCEGAFDFSHDRTDQLTVAGRYPPAYYAAVGWPSRITTSRGGLYAMRLVGAVVNAVLLWVALRATRHGRHPRLTASGVAVAASPMVVFLASVVNPSGVEICAAIALWATLLAFATTRVTPRSRWLVPAVVAAGSTLALSRGLGLAWLAAIAATTMLATGLRPLASRIALERRWRWAAATLGGTVVASAAWLTLVGGLSTAPAATRPPSSWGAAAVGRLSIGRAGDLLHQMIGVLQWLDTPIPGGVYLAWLAVLGMLVCVAVALGHRRAVAALALLAAAVIAIPIAADIVGARTYGIGWQGRYTLPLAAGVPILATFVIAAAPSMPDVIARRIGTLVLAVVAVGHEAALYWALHRNTVGRSGPVWFVGSERWHPPLPPLALLALHAAALAGHAWWVRGSPSTANASVRVVSGRAALDTHSYDEKLGVRT